MPKIELSDIFLFFNSAKKRKENPAKVSISVCKTSNALEINFWFPVAHQAIRFGKAFLSKYTYWPFVNNRIPREI